MQQIIKILFIVLSLQLFSQNTTDHTLFLTDGTTLVAKNVNTVNRKYVKVITKEGDKLEIPYNKIYRHLFYQQKTVFSPRNIPNLTEFVCISEEKGDMMPVKIEGKCNLYTGFIPQLRNKGAYGFYVKREGEKIGTCIGSNNWFESTDYKTIALEYFKDCPKMIARIQTDFDRKKVEELVNFYNKECF